jgi:glycosyltransferase involved in cell wall biosynthesis
VYISNSTEGEGFGLPAMEALSCGLLCILSSISSCLSFSDRRDFCFFVPERDPTATSAVLKEIIRSPSEKFVDIRKNALEISAHYSHEKACKNFEKILENILRSEDPASND